jgi:hypothetical protein
MDEQRPFDKDYVLNLTRKNMLKAVMVSIDKTFQRMPEFANDEVKSKELFLTLAELHRIKSDLSK